VTIHRIEDQPSVPTGKRARGAGQAGDGFAMPEPIEIPPALRMRDSRLTALIDACYPATARRLGQEGRVVVRLAIDAGGRASSRAIEQSSGCPGLDAAAECVVRRLDFVPGRRDGRAVLAVVLLPIAFRLD
jgi:protein TonB